MAWDAFSIMGIVAFAASGAIVAIEENYDVFGIYVLGFVTSFGGGIIRNLLIGLPLLQLWQQSALFDTAFITLTILIIIPQKWIHHSKQWIILFDALGLSAFSIQGAVYATSQHYPLNAVIIATVLTGVGGSILRDLLAGRKPFVLREEIYAIWAMIVGFAIGLRWANPQHSWELYTLFIVVFSLRMLSVKYNWKFPRKVWFESRKNKQTTFIG